MSAQRDAAAEASRVVHSVQVSDAWWPLWDLRLRSGDVELAPLREADLAALADLLPGDIELDPRATRFPGLGERAQRGVTVHQEYWRHLGTWTPTEWRLNCAVRQSGRLIGMQELEGNDFPTLRTVDTSSWLVVDARSTGIGKVMRRAVLALAFDHLGARAAITSAWQDNHASLGVSRSLGYLPNGESFLARGDGVDTLVHLRMTLESWRAAGGAEDVEVTGLPPALPLFGLASHAPGVRGSMA